MPIRRLLFALVALLLPAVAHAQGAVLGGTTTFLEKGVYKPLAGVPITIYRKAPVTSGLSQEQGRFSIPYAEGSPVYALFTGPNGELPLLQALNAARTTKHDVHVTLFTVEEAKSQGINPYTYVRAIIDLLTAVGVDPRDAGLQRLQALLSRLG